MSQVTLEKLGFSIQRRIGRGRRPPDFRRLGKKGSLGRGRGAKSNGSLLRRFKSMRSLFVGDPPDMCTHILWFYLEEARSEEVKLYCRGVKKNK
jgi:hypothetical protein